MKCYNIGRSNEIEVIGFYPQTKRAEGYHVDSINNISPNIFPNYTPQYGLELNPKSIATDNMLKKVKLLTKGITAFLPPTKDQWVSAVYL